MTDDTSYQPSTLWSIGSTLASSTSTSGSSYWNGISAYANAPIYTGSANYGIGGGFSLGVSSRGLGPRDEEEEPIVNEEIKRFLDFFRDNSL